MRPIDADNRCKHGYDIANNEIGEKEYTIVVECSLIDTITRNEEVESIIASDIYKNLLKGLLKAKNNVDDVDIVSVKVFVRDLEDKKDEE